MFRNTYYSKVDVGIIKLMRLLTNNVCILQKVKYYKSYINIAEKYRNHRQQPNTSFLKR